MRIGIIADTHGLVHPRVPDVFAGVDQILHAGDVGGAHVLEALRKIAPVTAVAGNNDDADGYEVARFGRILITHILPRPSKPGKHVLKALKEEQADVVIYGHSHLPHNEVVDGIRFFNPASAGPRRFDYPVSVGIIEDGAAYHVALDERSVAALQKRMNQMR